MTSCVHDESCREKIVPISQSDPNIQDAAVNWLRIDALFEHFKQNLVKHVRQKVTLHHLTSKTKAMYGLFKYVGKSCLICSCVKLVGSSRNHQLGACAEEENARHAKSQLLYLQNFDDHAHRRFCTFTANDEHPNR